MSLCCVYDTQWISDILKPLSTTTVVLGYLQKKNPDSFPSSFEKQETSLSSNWAKKDARAQLSNLRHKFVDKCLHFEILFN